MPMGDQAENTMTSTEEMRAHEHASTPSVQADAGPAVQRPRGMCVRAAELSAVRSEQREVDFIMSTGARDSYGEIVRQNWKLDRFAGNPVALFGHDSRSLPIGYWKDVRIDGAALRGTLVLVTAQANPLAENVWQSILQQSLRAVSVGFVPGKVTYEEIGGEDVCILDDNDLFECSVVPIPANPEALVEMRARAKAALLERRVSPPPPPPADAPVEALALARADAADETSEKGAVPYEAFPPVETDGWDAGNTVKRIRKWASSDGSGDAGHIDWNKYRKAFAWMDPQRSHEVGGFKLPHHDVRDGKLVTVRAGVIAAGNVLEGSRGGVKIPPADVAAVKSHLAKHYRQFDLTPPWEADKSTQSPVRAHTLETRMADTVTVEKKADDDEEMGVCPECGHSMKASEMGEAGKKNFHGLVQRRADSLASARVKAAEDRADELQKRNLELELNPLVGIKLAPEEVDGVLELGALWISKGADGRAKWEKHLKGIAARADLSTRPGGSVLGKEPAASRSTDSADPSDELIAKVNQRAPVGAALLPS